jgi:methylmalonyl-CoA mutase N-terminal domain/subunit
MRCHVQTAGSSCTAQEPENNIVRTALQALAAVLGGTNSLHTNSMDEALSIPTEKSARIALRTQQIIAHESGVARVADPLGGSYYVESLTDAIEREARGYIAEIEEFGETILDAVTTAVTEGYFHARIREQAWHDQMLHESGERLVVGVNCFESEAATPDVELFKPDPDVERRQLARLAAWRDQRDSAEVESSLSRLKAATETHENTMPVLMQAVKAGATVGEIVRVMRSTWGSYDEPHPLTNPSSVLAPEPSAR